MSRLNFLPRWYKNKRYDRIRKLLIKLGLLVFLLNLICVFFSYKEYSKYIIILNENERLFHNIHGNKIIVEEQEFFPNMKVAQIYEELSIYFVNRVVKSVDISESEVKINIFHTSLDNYLSFVKELENSQVFEVVDIQSPIKKEVGVENIITLKYIMRK